MKFNEWALSWGVRDVANTNFGEAPSQEVNGFGFQCPCASVDYHPHSFICSDIPHLYMSTKWISVLIRRDDNSSSRIAKCRLPAHAYLGGHGDKEAAGVSLGRWKEGYSGSSCNKFTRERVVFCVYIVACVVTVAETEWFRFAS